MMSSVCVGGHLCIGLWSIEGNVCALSVCVYMHIHIHILNIYFNISFLYIKKSKNRWRAESERFASMVHSTPPRCLESGS